MGPSGGGAAPTHLQAVAVDCCEGGLQRALLVLCCALRAAARARQAPAALVALAALHAPVQQQAAGGVGEHGDQLLAAVSTQLHMHGDHATGAQGELVVPRCHSALALHSGRPAGVGEHAQPQAAGRGAGCRAGGGRMHGVSAERRGANNNTGGSPRGSTQAAPTTLAAEGSGGGPPACCTLAACLLQGSPAGLWLRARPASRVQPSPGSAGAIRLRTHKGGPMVSAILEPRPGITRPGATPTHLPSGEPTGPGDRAAARVALVTCIARRGV